MKKLEQVIARGIQVHKMTERPKEEIESAVYSIYMPKDLITAYKQVCTVLGEKHQVVARRLLAKYIQEAQKEM